MAEEPGGEAGNHVGQEETVTAEEYAQDVLALLQRAVEALEMMARTLAAQEMAGGDTRRRAGSSSQGHRDR